MFGVDSRCPGGGEARRFTLVEQSSPFELVINMKTAKTLGLDVSPNAPYFAPTS